jgi:hypothetical protein
MTLGLAIAIVALLFAGGFILLRASRTASRSSHTSSRLRRQKLNRGRHSGRP